MSRILHILAPAAFGGLERVVESLAAALVGRGHTVHVAAVLEPGRPEPTFLTVLRETGVVVHPLAIPARAYWHERAVIHGLCRMLHPTVVHTHGYRPDVLDASVARRLDIPVVSTVHGFTGGGWKNRWYEWLQRSAWRRFEAVVAVSRQLGEQLARDGVPRERIHVVPNAWGGARRALERSGARRALGIPDGRFHVGWVGRLSREKGADVTIEALTHLADVPVTVSLLGVGREGRALRKQAQRLGVGDRVVWHGLVPAAGALFRGFDVFVLSSRTEGTPVVLFEAMAAEVPVVATRVGGVPDVVSDAEALLVAPGDPAALAAAIRSVWQDPQGAARRAAAARVRLGRDFAVEPWVAAYDAIYASVCRRPATRERSLA